MGDKLEARNMMIAAGVPVIPGTNDPIKDTKSAFALAEEIGFPVIVKAVHGGGGKGMRIVENPSDFEFLFETAKKESKSSFQESDQNCPKS